MVIEYTIVLDGQSHPVIISDEPEALLAAKAAGRAIIGVEDDGNKWNMNWVPYVIPGFQDAGKELAELILRRHLGLPWIIAVTKRLMIREFVIEDAQHIPEEEYGTQESVFRTPGLLAHYIEKQYGFYEYGTWALTEKESGILVGMAGVSNPNLPEGMDRILEEIIRAEGAGRVEGSGWPGQAGRPESLERPDAAANPVQPKPWLELGYHIFRPYRRMGYATEAVAAVMAYTHEVLDARLCALIDIKNQASRVLAENLGMRCVTNRVLEEHITGTDTQSSQGQLLYAESLLSQPDRADS